MKNRFEIAEAVEKNIAKLERAKDAGIPRKLYIREVCEELSIFDWWNELLSLTQLKEMRKFLKVAEEFGYDGYVCFKVGAAGCAHGMWAHREESTTGYSPDGEVLFHSFRSGDNYWDAKLPDGKWMHDNESGKYEFTLAEVKAALARF